MTKLEEAINTGVPAIISTAIRSIESFSRNFREYLLHELDNSCKNICLRSEPSKLRKNKFLDMTGFEWQKLFSEMSKRCSFLLDVLLTVMNTAKEECDEVMPRLGLCYAILMQTRNRELSLVQRLNTVLLTNGNAKKEVCKTFHNYICTVHGLEYSVLDVYTYSYSRLAYTSLLRTLCQSPAKTILQ